MRMERERALRAARTLVALGLWVGCGGGAATPEETTTPAAAATTASEASDTLLVAESDTPSLFLSGAAEAPAIGWTTADLNVMPSGPDENGRTPVRIDGAMRVKAYVTTELLGQKVQRRGRLRGSPVYVAPNDRVKVLGTAEDGRLRVSATPTVAGTALGPFEGTFPAVGIAPQPAPADAQGPRAGQWHELPAGTPLTLHDAPAGAVSVTVPASQQPLPVEVLTASNGWSAVRLGEGPYVIGYTNAQLRPMAAPPTMAPKASGVTPVAAGQMPERLKQEQGAVKLVAPGARVRFSGQIIAVFKQPGYARVLAEFPNDQIDVFCAADNGVAVRGLVERRFLSDPPAQP